MEKELLEALDAVRKATAELESKTAKNEGGTAELKSTIEKANKKLDELEAANQKLVVERAEELKKTEELVQQVKDLEVKAAKFDGARDGNSARDELKSLEHKALKRWCEGGGAGLEATEKKYLRSDSNVDGGFLMAQAYDVMVLKPITVMSALRQVCATKRVDALRLQMALRSALVESYWTGEGEAFTDSNSKYSRPEIQVHSMTTKTPITVQALLGGEWDMESELMGDMVESRLKLEGAAFVNGNSVKKPHGFMAASAAVPTMDSGDATSYDFDSLVLLTGELKAGYNPMFGFNRKELAYIRTLKVGAGTDAYAWQPGNGAAGVPNTLAGYAYLEIPDMPNSGGGLKPVIFADFRRLYTIVDAFNAIMLRNPFKTDGSVIFSMQSFVGGDVVMPEAGVILVCAE